MLRLTYMEENEAEATEMFAVAELRTKKTKMLTVVTNVMPGAA